MDSYIIINRTPWHTRLTLAMGRETTISTVIRRSWDTDHTVSGWRFDPGHIANVIVSIWTMYLELSTQKISRKSTYKVSSYLSITHKEANPQTISIALPLFIVYRTSLDVCIIYIQSQDQQFGTL